MSRRSGKTPREELEENETFHDHSENFVAPKDSTLHHPPDTLEMESNRSYTSNPLAARPSMIPGNLEACTCLAFQVTSPFRIRTACIFNGYLVIYFDKRKQWDHLCPSYCDDFHHAVNLRNTVIRVSQRRRHAHHYVTPWLQARGSIVPGTASANISQFLKPSQQQLTSGDRKMSGILELPEESTKPSSSSNLRELATTTTAAAAATTSIL